MGTDKTFDTSVEKVHSGKKNDEHKRF